jgi:hypothetical protein
LTKMDHVCLTRTRFEWCSCQPVVPPANVWLQIFWGWVTRTEMGPSILRSLVQYSQNWMS